MPTCIMFVPSHKHSSNNPNPYARNSPPIQHKVVSLVQPEKLAVGALVCISEHRTTSQGIGPALVVARMVVDGRRIIQQNLKTGKAAVVLHMVGDKLWEMGSRPTSLPDPMSMTYSSPSKAAPMEDDANGVAGTAKIEEVVEDGDATEPPDSADEGEQEQEPPQSTKIEAEPSAASAAGEPDIKLTPEGTYRP